MPETNTHYLEQDKKHYWPTFQRFPVTFDHGKGSTLWDVEGNEYVDALAGIAVNVVGHNHPVLVNKIKDQVVKLIHISNFYLSKPQAELARKLTEISGLHRAFFSNSGTESVEGAIKLARKYAHSIGKGGEIISFSGAFHGRTMAALASTGKKKMLEGFEPVPGGFSQVPFNDIKAARAAVSKETAAFIIEPIQGEGGIQIADPAFLYELRQLCDEEQIVLIFDEVQSGMGRTGRWFAFEHYGIKPDIMTLAKALGGGVPAGAILSSNRVCSAIRYGDHGTTFGGNPLACAAGLAVIEIIENEDLLQRAQQSGEWLMNNIQNLHLPGLKEIRGKGLMIGIEFDFETGPLAKKMFRQGVLANATAGNVLRLVPPLNITEPELEKIVRVLEKSLTTDSSL